MHLRSHDRRILAIALRSRRFGFAVFEGPNRLLDWGMVFYSPNDGMERAATSKRVASLLALFIPSVVVVAKTRLQNGHNGSAVRPILRLIRREASCRLIPVHVMKKTEVREVFHLAHVKSKYEIAATMAQMFPELLWKLPPKRRIWESEHPILAMFDAVAFGFAFWQHDGAHDPAPD